MDLEFAKVIITVELETDFPDACALFISRKEFSAAFRRMVGCRCSDCDSCTRTSTCPYYQAFAQGVSSDPAAVKRFQKPPLPFVFDFPVIPPVPNRGTELEANLVLVGSAVNQLDVFIAAFLQCGLVGRAGASIRKVESIDYAGNRHRLEERGGKWASGGLPLLSLRGLGKTAMLPMDNITISIETPMRILHDAKPLRELAFSAIARALMRRVSSIAYYYGGREKTEFDFKWLAMKSTSVAAQQYGFRWVEWAKGFSGVIGKGTFTGDMEEFHPFLLAGEYLHVGKGAAFGLGRFRLEREG